MPEPQIPPPTPLLTQKIPANLHFYRVVDAAVDAAFAKNPRATLEEVAQQLRTRLP